MEAEFPQLPVRDLISMEEARQFTSRKGGRFPVPQHVNGLQMSVKGDKEEETEEASTLGMDGGKQQDGFPPQVSYNQIWQG